MTTHEETETPSMRAVAERIADAILDDHAVRHMTAQQMFDALVQAAEMGMQEGRPF
jgi:hypothetical protein